MGALLVFSVTGYSQGSTCIETPLPKTKAELLEPYAAVFIGNIIEIEEAHVHDVIHFDIGQSWKGVDVKEVIVRKAFAGYKGIQFEVGGAYLVFASGVRDDLRINACSRTKKLAEASPEVNLLTANGSE
jgi:subtilase family serine protease